jgi:hypothetical protein
MSGVALEPRAPRGNCPKALPVRAFAETAPCAARSVVVKTALAL